MHWVFQLWPFAPAIFFGLFARELAEIFFEKEDQDYRQRFVVVIATMYLLLGTFSAYILWISDMRAFILSCVSFAGMPELDFFMVYIVAFAVIFISSAFFCAFEETRRKRSLRAIIDP